MPNRKMIFIVVLILVELIVLGIGFATRVWWSRSLAMDPGTFPHSTDQLGDSPFMGITDPTAPYDQRFIDEMVMHHQGAIISSEMMIGQSERPQLRDLARRIQESQQCQLEQMRAWRKQWYGSADVPTMEMDPMSNMMDSQGMGRMMGNQDMMSSQSRDRMFLRMMIPHHQLAIDMAEDALQQAEHEELKSLAQEIIADQAAEIAEVEGYLREWYGEASTRHTADDMRNMMQQMLERSSNAGS